MLRLIIRYLYYALIIATPLLVYSRTSELFEFNKMMFIYLDTLAIVCVYALIVIQEKRMTLKWHWLSIPMLLFLVSQILSTIFSIDVHTSIFGYYGRFNGGLLSIITYFALFFILVQIGTREFITILLKFGFGTAVFTVLWGLPGRVGLDLSCLVFTHHLTNACWTDQFKPAERMFSTLGQPNWLGAYLAINFFIGLWFLVKRDVFKNRSSILLICGIVLVFMGLLFTRSRSALLAVAAGIAVFSGGICFIDIEKVKKHILMIGVMAIVFFLSIVVFKTGIDKIDTITSFKKPAQNVSKSPTLKKVATSEAVSIEKTASPSATASAQLVPKINVTDSFDIRKIVWQGAWELGKKYPLFGTGVETFAYAYYFTRPVAHNYTSEWDFLYNKAHNEFLNYLATTGFIGLATYLIMIGSVIWIPVSIILKKKLKPEGRLLALGLLSSYITIHVTDFFGFSVSSIQIFFYLIPAFLLVYYPKSLKERELSFELSPILHKVWKGIIVILFSLGVIYLGRYYLADMRYALADVYARSGDYSTAYELYQQALVLRYEHVYEDKYASTLANLAFMASSESDKKLTDALIKLSDQYNAKTIKASPKNVLYWKTRAKNNYLFYQSTLDEKYLLKSAEAMGIAITLSPTDPKLAYSQALFYSLLYDESKDQKQKEKFKQLSLQEVDASTRLKNDFEDGYTLKKTFLEKYIK